MGLEDGSDFSFKKSLEGVNNNYKFFNVYQNFKLPSPIFQLFIYPERNFFSPVLFLRGSGSQE